MGIEALQQRPARMVLSNLETGDSISAQFNPDELKEELTVNYERLEVLGQSFQPLQYKSTNNLTLSFDLAFDAVSTRGIELGGGLVGAVSSVEGVALARRYLLHLCYPRKGAQDVSGGGPPRVHMYWPELFSMACRITKLSIIHKRWALSMKDVLFSASISVDQVSNTRIFSEDVLERGTFANAVS